MRDYVSINSKWGKLRKQVEEKISKFELAKQNPEEYLKAIMKAKLEGKE